MTMPETSLYLNNCVKPREDEVRFPGEMPCVQPEPESGRVHCLSDSPFRERVAPADSAHHSGPGRAIDCIRHWVAPSRLHPLRMLLIADCTV